MQIATSDKNNFNVFFQVQVSVSCILDADAASLREEAEAMAGTWDGMQREITKYVNLYNFVY